jgi:hypothetical protein
VQEREEGGANVDSRLVEMERSTSAAEEERSVGSMSIRRWDRRFAAWEAERSTKRSGRREERQHGRSQQERGLPRRGSSAGAGGAAMSSPRGSPPLELARARHVQILATPMTRELPPPADSSRGLSTARFFAFVCPPPNIPP